MLSREKSYLQVNSRSIVCNEAQSHGRVELMFILHVSYLLDIVFLDFRYTSFTLLPLEVCILPS